MIKIPIARLKRSNTVTMSGQLSISGSRIITPVVVISSFTPEDMSSESSESAAPATIFEEAKSDG